VIAIANMGPRNNE